MMVALNKLVSGFESLKKLIRFILFKIKPLVNKNYAYCKKQPSLVWGETNKDTT